MDNPEIIENFEQIIKQRKNTKSLKLYSKKENNTFTKLVYNPNDVLAKLSSQLKAIQNADRLVKNKCTKNMEIYKNKNFVPVNKLQVNDEEPQKVQTKAETQLVLDTQLMDIIENVEAISVNKGITQEFDTSFENNTKNISPKHNIETNIDNKPQIKRINQSEKQECLLKTVILQHKNVLPEDTVTTVKNKENYSSDTQLEENCTELLDKCIEIEDNIKNVVTDNICIDPSPVLNLNLNTNKLSPVLVFNLESFEKFEKIAVPIIEEHEDLKTVKILIDSQIMDKELLIQSNYDHDYSETEKQLSPVLKINDQLKIRHLNVDKCFDKELIPTDQELNEILTVNKLSRDNSNNEDEILFSSDEEICDKYTDFQDLPFTCALETSFYNDPDVLDKTMYVGFQTASNKSIQISTVSFTKAKSILDEFDDFKEDNDSLKNLVDRFDNSKSNIPKTAEISSEVNETCTKVGANLDRVETDFKNEDMSSFKTNANGNCIDVIFDKNIPLTQGITTETDISKNLLHLEENKINGFKTASNKDIKLSEKALARCKRVFQDIDICDDFGKGDIDFKIDSGVKKWKPNYENFDKYVVDNVTNIDDCILQEFGGEISLNDETNARNVNADFVGFRTASNKNIKISETALVKTKKIFDDIDFSDKTNSNNVTDVLLQDINKHKSSDDPLESRHNMKIQSVSNIKIKSPQFEIKNVSPKAEIDKAHLNEPGKINVQPIENPFIGFKTASNKNIRISDAALDKTKRIFDGIEFSESTDNANVKNILQKSNIASKTKGNIKNNESIIEQSKRVESSFVGFKTASNKHIEISDAALVTTKKIFEEIDNFEATHEGNYKTIVHKVAERHTGHHQNINNHRFKIPNTKNLRVSDADYSKTKEIIKNNDLSEANINNNNNFKTKQHVLPQNDLKDKVNEEQQEKAQIVENQQLKASFFGFKTASNKDITVSGKSLSAVKNIFKDIDLQEYNTSEIKNNIINQSKVESTQICVGTKTANKKEVHIRETDLTLTKNIFHDVSENTNEIISNNCQADVGKKVFKNIIVDKPSTNKSFVGFRTANNNKIKVSSVALAKTKDIFRDLYFGDESQAVASKASKDILIENVKSIQDNKVNGEFSSTNNKECKSNDDSEVTKKDLVQVSRNLSIEKETLNDTVNESQKTSVESKNEIKEDNCIRLHSFPGLKTANNKIANVSKDAMEKGRNFLKEIKFHVDEEMKENDFTDPEILKSQIFSFKTANSKLINVSEDSLNKSRRLFAELENKDSQIGTKHIKLQKINEPKNNVSLDKLIDTQVVNNFEESLYTEDFRETPKQSKRSGSPILSCPKAKRRKKFETPYKDEYLPKDMSTNKDFAETNCAVDDNYKKNKQYTLKDINKLEMNSNIVVKDDLLRVDYNTLLNFEFDDDRNDLTDSKLNIDLLKNHFLKIVNKNLIPDNWLDNHLRLILWKLISYELKFPKTMFHICTAQNVLKQLQYRYKRELYNAERPALRKIFEKDDVPSKTLVLCVMNIIYDGASESGVNQNIELLLTDGWYCIKACIDKMLAYYVREGKIQIGTKIVTNGAELLNCEQGVAPWEDTSSVRLKIFGNSTRRARWDARLGYHGNGAILSRLSTVKPEGGKVSKLRVLVTRVYPPLYVEKLEDGSTVTRSERLEHIYQTKYETDRQAAMEKIYEEVEREFSDVDTQESEDTEINPRSLESGSQILRLMKQSRDPMEFRANLTDTQRRMLEDHSAKKRDRVFQDIEEKVRSKMKSDGLATARSVVPLLKVRVAGVEKDLGVSKALLSIWKPNDDLTELVTEGAWIEILNVIPTAVRYSELQLSAGRQTVFKKSAYRLDDKMKLYLKSLSRKCYTIKKLITHPSMVTDYNEIDTVGLVIQIDPPNRDFKSINQFQNVYLTDEDKNMICVNFWGGIKKFGYENVLDTGQVVCCVNLQKRLGNTRKNIPQYRATEYTYFTKTPKSVAARENVEGLSKKISTMDKNRFILDCIILKDNLKCQVGGDYSPYRFNNHDITKNKVFIDSPLISKVNKIQEEFNLSGLDFESTFKQTDTQEISPKLLLRKKKVNEKIAKLKMYGEPPPLSPINIINKSKHAANSYKSPLVKPSVISVANTCDTPKVTSVKKLSDTPNVASIENLPVNSGNYSIEINSSPVLSVNRTYVKCVNPVKINFNKPYEEKEASVDHFAEEFDASPPLSLE